MKMRIIINNQSMVPIYEQLVNQLKDMILNGALSDEGSTAVCPLDVG